MNAHSFIILVIINGVISLMDHEYYDVGTVLFSQSDLNKNRWSNAEIALLKARENLIDLVPPPNVLLDSQTEEFPNSILGYFRHAYSIAKRHASDPESESLLKTALSDIVGGYMKMWILPITKYAYYGGTVPQDDALQLFQFHEDIKRYLNTDGTGWKKPKTSFLSSIPVNIVPLRTTHTRNAPDPCAGLAYFEKTESGLAIPVPNVNWNKNSESMFVPLKNQSLVSLNSPNSSHTLFKYYDTAKNCIRSTNIEEHGKFDERLQNWLVGDVIPHLNDEKLYPALRSVLSLVNKTRNLCDTVIDLYTVPLPTSKRTCIAGIPIDLSSKKVMVITIIILLEIVWCIPTLCYLMCNKMKKRRNNKNNVYFFIEPKRTPARLWAESTQYTPDTNATEDSKEISAPSKSTDFNHTPIMKSFYTETHFSKASERSMGTGTRSNFICQLTPTETVMFDHATSRRTSSKKLSNSTSINHFTTEKKASIPFNNLEHMVDLIPDKETESKTASFITVQELDPAKTVTILNEIGQVSKNMEVINYQDESRKLEKSIKRKNKGSKKYTLPSVTNDVIKRPKSHTGNPTANLVTDKPSKLVTKHSDHYDIRKSNRVDLRREAKCNIKEFKKISDKPLLEITIDKPHREQTQICVDINNSIRTAKPSRIPKWFSTNNVTQTNSSVSKKDNISSIHKSSIPQPKRKYSKDDINIHSEKSLKEPRLNVTL